MRLNDAQLARPEVPYSNTKANISALTGVIAGSIAYATDTFENGTYNGTTWDWNKQADIVKHVNASIDNNIPKFDGVTGKLIKPTNMYSVGGLLGIGTTTPLSVVHIDGPDASQGVNVGSSRPNAQLQVLASDAQSAGKGAMIGLGGFYNATIKTDYAILRGYKAVTSDTDAGGIFQVQTYGLGGWNIGIVLNNSGYVGVNTTTPGQPFDVKLAANRHIAFRDHLNTANLLAITDGSASYAALMIDATFLYLNPNTLGTVYIGAGADAGDLRVGNNCSALSFTDRTPYFEGDALSELMLIKGKNGEIDHSSLPQFAKSKHKVYKPYNEKHPEFGGKDVVPEERDLGAMISMLTVAVQQLNTRLIEVEKLL